MGSLEGISSSRHGQDMRFEDGQERKLIPIMDTPAWDFKLPPPGTFLSIFHAQGSPFITTLYINQYVADTVQYSLIELVLMLCALCA